MMAKSHRRNRRAQPQGSIHAGVLVEGDQTGGEDVVARQPKVATPPLTTLTDGELKLIEEDARNAMSSIVSENTDLRILPPDSPVRGIAGLFYEIIDTRDDRVRWIEQARTRLNEYGASPRPKKR